MPFPDVERVIYKKNPLTQVICQLKFPPILTIDAEIPAKFQDSIRKEFPNFTENIESMKFPNIVKGQIPLEILQTIQQTAKNYEFISEDGFWRVNLTRTFIALTCDKYERWEKFKDKLENPLNAFIDIYSPAYFSRIGLRYIDVIKKFTLGLEDVNWNDLLQPYILGILGSSKVGEQVQDFQSEYEILLADQTSKVKIFTRFVKDINDIENGEICYMIDSDFYNNNKIEIDNAINKLDYFNERGTRLIQWCITKKLHQFMEPEKLC